jgi:hypothetical protein
MRAQTAITFAVPLLRPGLFTADRAVVRMMRAAAPIAAVGWARPPPCLRHDERMLTCPLPLTFCARPPPPSRRLLMHPPVVGMEGCLLATKDIRWLVSNYITTGTLSARVAGPQQPLGQPPPERAARNNSTRARLPYTRQVLATQLLLKLAPLRALLDLNAIWLYLASYQAIRFVTFAWRLLASDAVTAGGETGGDAA